MPAAGGVPTAMLQMIATSLVLPPLGLLLLIVVAGLLAWRGRRRAGLLTAALAVLGLFLATPFAAGQLRQTLESRLPAPAGAGSPAAIILLGADQRRTSDGHRPGPVSLERMQQAARIARRTGLAILVTGGPLSPGARPIAALMAEALEDDFAIPVRWVETTAADTAGNAREAARMLRRNGISSAYLVTHAWHMPRAQAAFVREGFSVRPVPVSPSPAPDLELRAFIPRPDHLAESWFMLREWAGILVYRLRDGSAPPDLMRQ